MATAVTSLANSVTAALHGNVVTPNRYPGGNGTEATQISLGRKIDLEGMQKFHHSTYGTRRGQSQPNNSRSAVIPLCCNLRFFD